MSSFIPLTPAVGFLWNRGAAPASVTSETALLTQLRDGDLYEQFDAHAQLHQLYFRNRNVGGQEGMRWCGQAARMLQESVAAEDRYREFVLIAKDGTATTRFPSEIRPPMTLNFSEEWGRPDVIAVQNRYALDPIQKPLAYFLVSSLRFLETDVDWDAIDRAQASLRSDGPWRPITVAYRHDSVRHWAVDALSLSLAVYLSGTPYILGRITENVFGSPGLSIPEILTGRGAKDHTAAPLVPIATELTFAPRQDPDFPPAVVTLMRQGRPCPVIIERCFPEDFDRLPDDLREEATHRWQQGNKGNRPFFRALRTLDGEYQALSLSFLVTEDGGHIRMNCERAVMRDRDPGSKIEGVGLAFLVSALRYMKDKGHWEGPGQILYNFIPRVLNAYRRQAGLTPRTEPFVALEGVSRSEGEEFLRKSRLEFEPIPSPSPATATATPEAVLLDGRPAG